MDIISVYGIRTKNIGDLSCSPSSYFQFLRKANRICVTSFTKAKDEHIVVGGGGVLLEDFDRAVLSVPKSTTGKTVAWGIGINYRQKFWFDYSKLKFDIIGVRDWIGGVRWVPCVSCMSSLFDKYKTVVPTHEVVVYRHHNHCLDYKNSPNITNEQTTMESAISHLAKGNTIVTNSYHGAYWATLLGRKVVVVNPPTSKFLFFKHKPILSSIDGIKDSIKMATSYSDSLEECRSVNLAFAREVENLFQ